VIAVHGGLLAAALVVVGAWFPTADPGAPPSMPGAARIPGVPDQAFPPRLDSSGLEAEPPRCPGLAGTAPASQGCSSCHAKTTRHDHPVDVDYAGARLGNRELRSPEEVVRRGLFLPNGRVDCLTCHDPRSPYRSHVALPPGSRPTVAVNPKDRSTYEEGPALNARTAALRNEIAAGRRPGVGVKPLCLGCHALD
jgi:hypothetical protein